MGGWWGHTAAVKVDVHRPRPWSRRLVHSHGDHLALVARHAGIVHARGLRRWPCAVRVQHRVLGAEHREVNGLVGGVGHMLVVELDEHGVQMRQHRGVDGVERFVAGHYERCDKTVAVLDSRQASSAVLNTVEWRWRPSHGISRRRCEGKLGLHSSPQAYLCDGPMLAKNIPFEIYERDPNPDARGQGWAITLHWALEYIQQILPADTLARIQAVQVDPDVARHDNGNFLFINLATGEPVFKIPPSVRWRVNREKTRKALLHGIEDHVHWDHRVVGLDVPPAPAEPVALRFADGSRVAGRIVVGVEGSRSLVRQVLRPDAFSNVLLPIRFTGVAVDLTPAEIAPLRAMDPLLFQGCHPRSGTFFWFSMLETPAVNGTAGTPDQTGRLGVFGLG
ncbi:conserved hypothetical protein [Aspergillus terreus NIH2624]|uniref:FAD-binding domain-containing protein n=1 Tax=Aspergillus terreus (strain NIH 2624 / FGSC A1156) TaxID=341663 RepID=Q0CNB2_ASPTN|nr:uncharacterized protein ATEG_04822 [Aspergillus terreus NIH2624]EAU35269.1 conserved hypothetical protein [Aspergillus terreus NIH2624]